MGIVQRITQAVKAFRQPAQARGFAAAQLNRLTSSWQVTQEKINDEIRNDLDALRNRSRALENNNDFARNYLDIVETNLIGPDAPRLVSLVDNAPGAPDDGARVEVVRFEHAADRGLRRRRRETVVRVVADRGRVLVAGGGPVVGLQA